MSVRLEEPTLDNLGERVTCEEDAAGELFRNSFCYISVIGEGLGGKGGGLIGKDFGTIVVKGFNYAPQAC